MVQPDVLCTLRGPDSAASSPFPHPLPSVCASLGWQLRDGSHSCGLLSGALIDSCMETHKFIKARGCMRCPQELLWALSPPAVPGMGFRWQFLWLWQHKLFFQL